MARGRKPATGDKAMTAAERQRRRRALKQFSETRRYAEDPRREKPLSITWNSNNLIGRIRITDEYWAAVEWSEKHHCWCIEDSEGACLAHEEAIRGAAASKDGAVALATEMIRDGRMPSPQEAKQLRWERLPEEERVWLEARAAERAAEEERRRERDKDPAVQRRRAKAQQRAEEERQASTAAWETKRLEDAAQPVYEVLNDVFDFADPELWKSNSFAALRPRLILHLEAVVANLERDRLRAITEMKGRNRVWYKRELDEKVPRLAKAREILELLRAA
jgi:hypothetical protein